MPKLFSYSFRCHSVVTRADLVILLYIDMLVRDRLIVDT